MYFGESVDGAAEVSSSDGSTLGGTITFYDGAVSRCVLPATTAGSCPASAGEGYAAGTHVLTAVYSGDATHAASTSNAVTITVLKDTTTATLTSSNNPALAGQNINFTATIQGAHATPAGSVAFYDGANALATTSLDETGTATIATSALAAGTHSVTAVFGATDNFAAAISPQLSQNIQSPAVAPTAPPSFTIDATSVSVKAGETVSIPVTVSSANGTNGILQLSCSNLPDEATCTYSAGSKPTLLLKTAAPRDCGTTEPYGSANLPFAAPVAAGLFMVFVPKRRSTLRGLLIALIAAGTLAVTTGCGTGNCTDLGTRPGTYTFTVTGTSSGAPTVVSQKVIVKVTI